MQTHTVILTIPHNEINFFAGFFMGRAGSDEITDIQRYLAQKNFDALAPFLDNEQKAELHEAALVIYDSATYETMKKDTTDFFDRVKSYLGK